MQTRKQAQSSFTLGASSGSAPVGGLDASRRPKPSAAGGHGVAGPTTTANNAPLDDRYLNTRKRFLTLKHMSL